MPSVAEQLRAAREARGLTIQQVADITKLRADHVRALEEGDYGVFSAPVYLRGFVRSYASILKLDSPPLIAALDGEIGSVEKFKEPAPATQPPNPVVRYLSYQISRINRRVALIVSASLAVVIILIASITAWQRHLAHSDPLAHFPAGVYQSTRSGETLPLPSPTPATNPPPRR